MAHPGPVPPEAAAGLSQNWMKYYSSEGITAIHSGAIAMRRRSGENWLRMDEGPDRARSPFGDAVLRAFAIGDYLRDHDDAALLGERLPVSRDIHMVQRCDCSAGEWRAHACQLRLQPEL